MRCYRGKTNRAEYAVHGHVKAAILDVFRHKLPVKHAAIRHGIPRTSLTRQMKRFLEHGKVITEYENATPRIFNEAPEKAIKDYIVDASNVFMEITTIVMRILAHWYALKCNIKVPGQWSENKRAGLDWLRGYLKRWKLSERKPEAISRAQANGFNREDVNLFYTNLEILKERHRFLPKDIWSLDETGISTVQKTGKVIAPTGRKQVGGITSGERGPNVTVCAAVNSIGNSVPSHFISLRTLSWLVCKRWTSGLQCHYL